MDYGISGRTAIVCAASQGLGKGCAMALAREGVNLVINARGADALNATADEIRATTGVERHRGRRRHHVARRAARKCWPRARRPTSWSTTPAVRRSATSATGTRAAWQKAVNDNMVTPIMLIRAVVDGMIAAPVRAHRQHHVAIGEGAARASRPVERRARRA